jgi:hypothetical protein
MSVGSAHSIQPDAREVVHRRAQDDGPGRLAVAVNLLEQHPGCRGTQMMAVRVHDVILPGRECGEGEIPEDGEAEAGAFNPRSTNTFSRPTPVRLLAANTRVRWLV